MEPCFPPIINFLFLIGDLIVSIVVSITGESSSKVTSYSLGNQFDLLNPIDVTGHYHDHPAEPTLIWHLLSKLHYH